MIARRCRSGTGSPRRLSPRAGRAGSRSTRTTTPPSSPTTTGCVIGGTAWDFANDATGSHAAASTCWSSRRPASSAWPTPSRSRGPPATCCCSATRSSCRRSARAPTPSRSTPRRWAGSSRVTTRCPTSCGYFLDRSYRMHPAVCARGVARCPTTAGCAPMRATPPRADLDGHAARRARCWSSTTTATRRSSPEEAAAIVAEIETPARRRHWTDEHGTRPLRQARRAGRRPVQRAGGRCCAGGSTRPDSTSVERRHRRQVPGPAGAGRVRLDDGVLDRRRAARNRVPAQPESAQRRGQPGQVRGVIVRSPTADRLPADTPDRLVELGAFLSLAPCDRPTG